MTEQDKGVPYVTAKDFERALVDRMANAAAESTYSIGELRRQLAFDRLLSRVFTDEPASWVLKSATGLLARIPGQARHSIDIDLHFAGQLETALDALRKASAVDLGDYFTFDIERGPNLSGVTTGSQLRVVAYLGDKEFERFRIDVVVTHTMTSDPEEIPPIEPVEIAGLQSVPYRAHPIPDQIADKHAAMQGTYAGRPSTRYRDLVDLVLIATTQTVDAERLHTAVMSEHERRGAKPATKLSLPSGDWAQGYRKIAEEVADFEPLDAETAVGIVRRLVDPIIAGLTSGTWDPGRLEWKTN